MHAAPMELLAKRPRKMKNLGLRQKMFRFAKGQIVFLLNDREVTPGNLRAGAEGRVIELDGDKAFVLFALGAIRHPELLCVHDVGWVSDCTCRGTTRNHRAGCALDMSAAAMNAGDPERARAADGKDGL